MAYEATAISSSTSEEKVATNAVDEDPWSYALTETEKYPRLTITLSNIFTTKWIYLILLEGKVYEERSIYLSIYISINLSNHPSIYPSIYLTSSSFFLQIGVSGFLFTSQNQLKRN